MIRPFLKINHDKTGKQRVHASDDIAHLPVFLFQTLLFLPGPSQQRYNIDDEQYDQDQLQDASCTVRIIDHGLGYAFREHLHKDVFVVRQVDHTDIIRLAAVRADISPFSAELEYIFYMLQCLPGRNL